MFALTIVPLVLAASALANVFLVSPVASSSFPAGQNATVTWQENNVSPSLAQFGRATFAIYVGNAIEQTPLQTIATHINVSEITSFTFVPDSSIGPNSGEYFIRVTSETMPNPDSPQYYEEAFSAKFTLSGMSGTFNSTLQAEINGQSTAPIGGTTSAASTATAAGASTPTMSRSSMSMSMSMGSSVSMTSSASSASASASATTTTTNGASKPALATGLVALIATLVGAALS